MSPPGRAFTDEVAALRLLISLGRLELMTATRVECPNNHVLARVVPLGGLPGAPRLLITEVREEGRRDDGQLGIVHTNRRTSGVYLLDRLLAEAEAEGVEAASVRTWCRCGTSSVPLRWLIEQVSASRPRVILDDKLGQPQANDELGKPRARLET